MLKTRTIRVNRWGNGLGIRLPKEFVDRIKITDSSQVEVRITDDDGLLVTRSIEPKKHISLAVRFKGYNGEYKGESIDWGQDVGGEVCE